MNESGVLQVDFTGIPLDRDWLVSRESRLPAPETNLGALPEEDWTPEHERTVADCFLRELKELLSPAPAPFSPLVASIDFLPFII